MNNKKLCGDKKRGVLIQPERAGCSEDVEVTMSAVHKRIEGAPPTGGQLNQDTFNPRQHNRMLFCSLSFVVFNNWFLNTKIYLLRTAGCGLDCRRVWDTAFITDDLPCSGQLKKDLSINCLSTGRPLLHHGSDLCVWARWRTLKALVSV